jgi:hypothetical protein
VEYQKACHDEEDQNGGKRRPHFPGISDGSITVRPLQDNPADVAALAAWLPDGGDLAAVRRAFVVDLPLDEVPCLVTLGGRPTGYVQYAEAGPAAYRIGPTLGDPGEEARHLLTAYLFEFEGAERVLALQEFTRDTFRPEAHPFHLLVRK